MRPQSKVTPLNYYPLLINTLKWWVRQIGNAQQTPCQGLWKPLKTKQKKTRWLEMPNRRNVRHSKRLTILHCFPRDRKLNCRGWILGWGVQAALFTHRWEEPPPLASFTSRGNRDSREHSVRGFPAPIRKPSLCKFNDGDHGGKTSCIKI